MGRGVVSRNDAVSSFGDDSAVENHHGAEGTSALDDGLLGQFDRSAQKGLVPSNPFGPIDHSSDSIHTMHPMATSEVTIVHGDNLEFLRGEPEGVYRLIYVDPPFNTGETRQLVSLKTERDPDGDRRGYGGATYRSREVSRQNYGDRFDNYIEFLRPRIEQAARVLTADGSLFVHVDPRESHYVKILLDEILGRRSFLNEIVWAYDFGGRSKRRWPAKHDVVFWYAKDPANYVFDYDAIDRIPYLAPGLVGEEKARRGKVPTDVWWQTIVPPGGKERTGYPTQKPLAILDRIVRVHSAPGDTVLDFFAGSGTTGAAALQNGRSAVLVDENPAAIRVIQDRLAGFAQHTRRGNPAPS